jgi:urease accessory protein
VTWAEATKRRLRRTTSGGEDVAIDVPRGTYQRDGAVLADDGVRLIVIERAPEDALVLTLPGQRGEVIRAAALVGHAFGNQHVPIDVAGDTIRVPLTTSEEIARATVAALGLTGVGVSVERVALAAAAPMLSAHGHGHDHG